MKYIERLENEIIKLVKQWKPTAKAYTVGGCVRDELLAKSIKDFDVVIDCPDSDNPAIDFVDFLKKSGLCKNFATYPRFGTARFTITVPGKTSSGTFEETIECVMPRKEHYFDGPRKPSDVEKATIAIDASRRDFCCNALYKDLETKKILDPTGHGLSDLNKKILRTPLDPNETFKDDPLRMLRAIRFACVKEFSISEEVKSALRPIPEYYELSMERVRDEFLKIISSGKAKEGIWLLHETGLLAHIIPELEESWGFNQNSKYHSMNLTDHLLEVLDKCIYGRVTSADTIRTQELAMAALLHDISKYRYREIKEDGTFSYHNHEEQSAEMAKQILTRLKCSNSFITYVTTLIRNHMIIKQSYNPDTMEYTGNQKSILSIVDKFCNLPTGFLNDLLDLIDADNLSHAPKYCMPGQVDNFIRKWTEIKHPILNSTKNKLPVSGDDIISEFGIKPGKRVGAIKEIMKDLWMYVTNPTSEVTKEDLIAAYRGEFEGKKIFIWKHPWMTDGGFASIVEPSWDQSSGDWVCDADEKLCLDDCESYLVPENISEIRELSALEYPDIYLRCRTHKSSRDLINKIIDLTETFYQMPGFRGLNINIDNYGDFSAKIDWYKHKSDYIL